MFAKMNPVVIRKKIEEVKREIADLQREKADQKLIYMAQRKLSVLNKWLEDAEKPEG